MGVHTPFSNHGWRTALSNTKTLEKTREPSSSETLRLGGKTHKRGIILLMIIRWWSPTTEKDMILAMIIRPT